MDLRERANNDRRHPWELARADFFCKLVIPTDTSTPVRVLDLGAGDTFFAERLLTRLPEGSSVTCVDPGYPESWLGEQSLHGGRSLIMSCEAPLAAFDWVTLLDVLEHVEDDDALLRAAVERLEPNGHALVSVPAWQALYTDHDTQLGHLRRYSPGQLLRVLSQVGLRPELHGGLFSSLLLPRWLTKLGEIARGHRALPHAHLQAHIETSVGGWSGGSATTKALRWALEWDGRVGLWWARKSMPLPGLSTWAMAGRQP